MVHETIKSEWDWMKGWIDERREAFNTFSLFENDAKRWMGNRTDSNVVYSQYHFDRLRTLCDNDLDNFASVAEEKLGFNPEKYFFDYVERFRVVHRTSVENEQERQRIAGQELDRVRFDAKAASKRRVRRWQWALASVLAIAAMGAWGGSVFHNRELERQSRLANSATSERNSLLAAESQAARRVQGCWQEVQPVRPVDCNRFRIDVRQSGSSAGQNANGQMVRACLYENALASERSYQVSAGTVSTESMYGALPGQWKFVSDGEFLLWSIEGNSQVAQRGIYRRMECAAPR